jgi:hypothetical protein
MNVASARNPNCRPTAMGMPKVDAKRAIPVAKMAFASGDPSGASGAWPGDHHDGRER